jgi:hypothetical protein
VLGNGWVNMLPWQQIHQCHNRGTVGNSIFYAVGAEPISGEPKLMVSSETRKTSSESGVLACDSEG